MKTLITEKTIPVYLDFQVEDELNHLGGDCGAPGDVSTSTVMWVSFEMADSEGEQT